MRMGDDRLRDEELRYGVKSEMDYMRNERMCLI